jgi:mRNA interferase MazF
MYKPFDIIITPFPFVDELGKFKYRPALAISSEEYSKSTNCTVFLMITSAKNSDFANDYKIQDYSNTNLQGDCIVRFKIFTLDNSILKNKIGELNEVDRKEVMKILENSLCKNLK